MWAVVVADCAAPDDLPPMGLPAPAALLLDKSCNQSFVFCQLSECKKEGSGRYCVFGCTVVLAVYKYVVLKAIIEVAYN